MTGMIQSVASRLIGPWGPQPILLADFTPFYGNGYQAPFYPLFNLPPSTL